MLKLIVKVSPRFQKEKTFRRNTFKVAENSR